MQNNTKTLIALLLIIFGVFGSDITSLVPSFNPEPPAAKILNIQEPSREVLGRVSNFSGLVTDPDDRAKIAIFNYEFAERITSYETTSQQVNDVYSLAGKIFFDNKLVDKYDGLAEKIVALMQSCVGKDNHTLTQKEKNDLNENFLGLAWVLIHTR
tara:strand:+ start:1328 stop:1795 length:468 start_codon:yes stop_codon:yes gene_type:complete